MTQPPPWPDVWQKLPDLYYHRIEELPGWMPTGPIPFMEIWKARHGRPTYLVARLWLN
jgi:hypothetical protein